MRSLLAVLGCAALLGGCAATGVPSSAPPVLPEQWYAPPLPHQGRLEDLSRWWDQLGDPLLSDWIIQAQRHSPNIAAAQAQVIAARAAVSASETLGGPQVALVASASRLKADAVTPQGNALAAGVQASWELDLWGGKAAEMAAARAQADAAGAGWHEARVLVAAELARLYVGHRLCRAQLAVATGDRDSRAVTARSSAIAERAGLTAPAVLALARASEAEAGLRTQTQAELCERQIKALVAMTGVPEPDLRQRLASPQQWTLQDPSQMAVQAVPAESIRQRPDVYRAQRELVAAAELAGAARAQLLPNLRLSGNVLRNRFTTSAGSLDFNTWSVGPLSLSLPLIGRAALHANADAARARYEAAAVAYASTLRQAVSDVEQALVTIAGLAQRQASTDAAVAGYGQSLRATEARYQVGLASLNELEEARRLRLSAESSAIALQQERFAAWLALYLALGGGFDPATVSNPTPSAS